MVKVGEPIKASVFALLSLIKRVALEPTLTGPLLLFLTKAPEELRLKVLRLVTANPYNSNPHIARSIRALKVLFTLGVIRTVNGLLNSLALNHWRIKKLGAPWDFPNEVAIVTGGSSGFGKLIAEGLAKKIKHVAVLDIKDPPSDLADKSNIPFYKCDITNRDEVKEVAATVRREHGIPTILVNNAGIASRRNVMDTTPEQLRQIFEVNLLSHYALVQEFLPGMLQAQKGHVVTIASMASYGGFGGLVDYCCTKAGELSFHEGLSSELRNVYVNGRTIQTTVVHPTWAQTNIIKDWEPDLNKKRVPIMPPEAVVNRVVSQILSGRSGQLFIPSRGSLYSGVRGFPHWFQELFRDAIVQHTKAA